MNANLKWKIAGFVAVFAMIFLAFMEVQKKIKIKQQVPLIIDDIRRFVYGEMLEKYIKNYTGGIYTRAELIKQFKANPQNLKIGRESRYAYLSAGKPSYTGIVFNKTAIKEAQKITG